MATPITQASPRVTSPGVTLPTSHQGLRATHQETATKLQWVLRLESLAPGGAAPPPLRPRLPRHPAPQPTTRCQMATGAPLPLAPTVLTPIIKKEMPATVAGRAWRMTPLAWEEAEATAWGVWPVSGVALEEAKGVEKAQEAGPAQTGTLASPKVAFAGRAPLQCCQFCPEASWTQEFCPTAGGGRRPFVRTALGMFLPQTTSNRGPESRKESRAVEILVGAPRRQQPPPNCLEGGLER